MLIRYLKIDLVIFISLMCLFYATQNVVNLESAYQFVAAVATMDGHAAYPASFGPAITSPALIWTMLAFIILLEYSAGVLAARGAWDLWKSRKSSAAEFNAAKTYANLGGGVALIVWFGLFTAIGGSYFQMWQTELGGASLQGSFQFTVSIGIVLLFVNMAEQDQL